MSVPLAQLVIGARTAASMQQGGPWEPSEWDAAVNNAVRAFWVDVLAANNTLAITYVNDSTTTITSTASPFFALPADFMNVYSVIENPGTQMRRELRKSGDRAALHFARTYRINGKNLWIDPLEQSVGTYELGYNPLPTLLTATQDLDGELIQHREYFELHAAIAALTSEQSPTTDIQPRFLVCQQRALAWAARQRSSEPSRPRDVRPRGGRGRLPWGWP